MDFFGDFLNNNSHTLLGLSDLTVWIIPIALFGTIVTGVMAATTPRRTKSDQVRQTMIDALDATPLTQELTSKAEDRRKRVEKMGAWSRHWYQVFQKATVGGIDEIRQPGMIALSVAFAGGAAGAAFMGPVGVVVGPPIALAALSSVKSFEASKKNAAFDTQLGLLVDAMKQNLQGGKTPPNALADSIEDVPDPLYSELYSVRNEILTGSSMSDVLAQLGERNESREMKFLASALQISIYQGGNLQSQLKVIQEKLDARARISRKIKEAVSKTKPTVVVVAAAVPLATLYAFMQESGGEALSSLMGLGVLGFSYVSYAVGLWMVVRAVRKTSDF